MDKIVPLIGLWSTQIHDMEMISDHIQNILDSILTVDSDSKHSDSIVNSDLVHQGSIHSDSIVNSSSIIRKDLILHSAQQVNSDSKHSDSIVNSDLVHQGSIHSDSIVNSGLERKLEDKLSGVAIDLSRKDLEEMIKKTEKVSKKFQQRIQEMIDVLY